MDDSRPPIKHFLSSVPHLFKSSPHTIRAMSKVCRGVSVALACLLVTLCTWTLSSRDASTHTASNNAASRGGGVGDDANAGGAQYLMQQVVEVEQRNATPVPLTFPHYPFTSLLPVGVLIDFMSSCSPEAAATKDRPVDHLVSLLLLCDRNPRTPGVDCPAAAATPTCIKRQADLKSCAAAFDTWLPCPQPPHTQRGSTALSMVEQCTAHHGLAKVEAWVPTHCKDTSFWRLLAQHVCSNVNCAGRGSHGATSGAFDESMLQLGDVVSRSQRRPLQPPRFVELHERHEAPYPTAVSCRQPLHNAGGGNATDPTERVATFHGINFGYPLELMANDDDDDDDFSRSGAAESMWKVFGFSVASPKRSGEQREYGLHDEYRLLFDTRRSMFAFTTRRWGWDCLRHVEQLGAGIIPLFVDLPLAPPTVLQALPKQELLSALGRPEVRHIGAVWTTESSPNAAPHNYFIYTGPHKQDGGAHVAINASVSPFVDVPRLHEDDYRKQRKILLRYARRHLTTGAMAASVLRRMGHPEARRVLFLHGVSHMDFLKLSLHHGLVNGLGLDVVSFPRSESHFQAVNVSTMKELEHLRGRHLHGHGNGYAYGMRVYDGEGGAEATNLERRIFAREFDVVIFTFTSYSASLSKQLPLFREVIRAYPPDRVAFVNGDDVFGPPDDRRPPPLALYASKFGHVFMRELYPLAEVCPDPRLERTELVVQRGTSNVALRNDTASANVTQDATEGVPELCVLPTVKATPFPFEHSSRSAAATDAFLVHVDAGNLNLLVSFVVSVREHSRLTAPLIVLIATSNASVRMLREVMGRGELDVARPVVVHYAKVVARDPHYEGVAVQRRFLAAVEHVLQSPVVFGLRRFVVAYLDTPIQLRGDLLRSVGGLELWVARHSILVNHHHVGTSRYCFGGVPSVDPTHQHHIGHQIFGGSRGALLQLIAAMEVVYSFTGSVWCGYDAALSFVVHNGTFDGRLTIFSSERGPVVFDTPQSDRVCELYRPLVTPVRAKSRVSSVALPCATTSLAAVVVGDGCKLVTPP